MSRCHTIKFQTSIISKSLVKHISTKVSFKITILKDMFKLTFVYLEYKTSYFIWNLLNHEDKFAPISGRYTVIFTNTYETEIHNEF